MLNAGAGKPAKAAVSSGTEAARYAADVPFHEAFEYLNALPEPCRILVLSWTVPPYYLQRDYVKVAGMYHERPIEGIDSPDAALAHLEELGITHVLDVRWPPNEPAFLVPFPLPSPLTLVSSTSDGRVFAVRR